MLDKTVFMDSLKEQFRDDIKMIIIECQQDWMSYLDIKTLNHKLTDLKAFAHVDGLSEDDWLDLIYETCPQIYNQIDFGPVAA